MGAHDHVRACVDCRPERNQLTFFQPLIGTVDQRKTGMAVRCCIPVAREMLQCGNNPGVMQSGQIGAAKLCDSLRIVGKRADSDHRIGRVVIDVHYRGKIRVDTQQSDLFSMDTSHLPGVFRISGRAQRHIADTNGAVRNPVDISALLVHEDQLGNPAAVSIGCLQIRYQPQRLLRIHEVLPEQENPAEMVPGDHFPDLIVQLRNIRFG